jgi:hypothetical protein
MAHGHIPVQVAVSSTIIQAIRVPMNRWTSSTVTLNLTRTTKMNKIILTFELARQFLQKGTILNHSDARPNSDGTPARFKVTSVKTWKRDTQRIEIKVQRGLYEHYCWDGSAFDYAEITIQSAPNIDQFQPISRFQNEEELDNTDREVVR